jgi:hypothetical protein
MPSAVALKTGVRVAQRDAKRGSTRRVGRSGVRVIHTEYVALGAFAT